MLVAKGNRLQRQNRFARLVHRFDLFLETLGRNNRAEMSIGIDNYSNASGDSDSANAGNKGVAVCSSCADADAAGFAGYARVTDIDIVIAGGEITAGRKAEGDVEVSSGIISQRIDPVAASCRCRWCYAEALLRRWPC